MTIDTARLATDAGYWDKLAPKGATHYDPTDSGLSAWMMKVDDRAWCFFDDDGWNSVDYSDVAHDMHAYIPRPQSEWVDGLPPVGTKVEVWVSNAGYWAQVSVLAVDVDTVVWRNGTDRASYIGTHIDNVRPIKTKAQRDRDELKSIIADHEHYGHDYVTDKIIAAGWTKP